MPGVLRVHLNWNVGIDLSVSSRIFYSYLGTSPTSAQLTTWGAFVSSTANGNLAPLMSTSNSYQGCVVTDLSTPTSGQGADTTPHTGSRTGSFIPGSACVLLNILVARRYRGGKPRVYFPFGVQADLADPQHWTGSAQTAFQTGIGNFISGLGASPPAGVTSMRLCNVSYYQGFVVDHNTLTGRYRNVPTPRVSPLIDIATTYKVNPLVGSQRRRINA